MERVLKSIPILTNVVYINDFKKYGKDTIQAAVNACADMGGGTGAVPCRKQRYSTKRQSVWNGNGGAATIVYTADKL